MTADVGILVFGPNALRAVKAVTSFIVDAGRMAALAWWVMIESPVSASMTSMA